MSSVRSLLRSGLLFGITIATLLASELTASAQCPVGTVIRVDYDLPNSGYSEESQNWDSWQTTPCNPPTYRYLSAYVGDGSRKGKAIWKPSLPVAGYYSVRTGFRPTTNRTNDADYFTYDDAGNVTHKSVDQSTGSTCTWADLGSIFCNPGGNCRVVLDGTDDNKSDEADITTFELTSCTSEPDGGTVAGRCDGIRANPSFEVCAETATTCAGVFTQGEGCVAYCAAAGMTCVARFGGEPGCSKEAATPIANCAADNGHASDWCECEGSPIEPDAGAAGSGGGSTGGAGGAAGTGGSSGAGGDPGTTDASADGGSAGGGWDAMAGTGGASPPSDAAASEDGGPVDYSGGTAFSGEESGCGCSVPRGPARAGLLLLLLSALWLRRRGYG